MVLTVVDFPAPLSPSSATISARPTWKDTLLSTLFRPYCLLILRSSSSGVPLFLSCTGCRSGVVSNLSMLIICSFRCGSGPTCPQYFVNGCGTYDEYTNGCLDIDARRCEQQKNI